MRSCFSVIPREAAESPSERSERLQGTSAKRFGFRAFGMLELRGAVSAFECETHLCSIRSKEIVVRHIGFPIDFRVVLVFLGNAVRTPPLNVMNYDTEAQLIDIGAPTFRTDKL